jgi:hypothetical protein
MAQKLSNLQTLLALYNRKLALENEIKRLGTCNKSQADRLRNELKETKTIIRVFEFYLLNSF